MLNASIFLGCLPDYFPERFDHTDKFICPASACHEQSNYFPCSDGKYCIGRSLVCDGYSQCEDGSGNSLSILPSLNVIENATYQKKITHCSRKTS